MKKLLIFILVVMAATVASIMALRPDQRSDLEKFREAMNFAIFDQYTDSAYGYSLTYPTFFQKEEYPDPANGHAQFGYHAHNLNLVIECQVGATNQHKAPRGDFIDTGSVKFTDDYKYYSHHILKENHCFILTFYYPRRAENAVGRIIYRIKKWKPFSEKKLTLGNQEP
ncbi:hypothetical protein C7120_12580 [Prevotella sp. oral taxon 376]|uniref:hypothetical protein n=1 Tax=Prevotella sp. oral taxon 376 TaxID=712466 RepID=UPI000D1D8D42|nr:hypothetical protein [Prevotella sp. oral taxon 376]PTL32309.1 hypothetical protein C7120_12580 [Prevotella sp. oral taxon 376]